MSVYSGGSGFYFNTDSSTASTNTISIDTLNNTTLELPDPLIDWLPYKWKKYLPTWHLVKSYGG